MPMMEDFIGTYGNRLIVAVVGVGVALLALAFILWLIRRRNGASPFIRGGRNRQPRLQVLDATAIDARRRLVLVRRDNVEHLVMIGGPTDIVIESGIGAIPILTDVSEREPAMKAIAPDRDRDEPKTPVAAAERRQSLPAQPAVPTAPAVSPPPVTAAPVARASTPPIVAEPSVVADRPPLVERPPIAPPAPVTTRPVTPPAAPATPAPAVIAPEPSGASSTQFTRVEPPSPYTEHAIQAADAHSILDAARERVMPRAPATNAPAASSIPAPASRPTERSRAFDDTNTRLNEDVSSEFERILENEMAKSRAAAEPVVQTFQPQAAQSPLPRPEPSAPPITGASTEGDVQKEMARIFGEMSVTRDR